MKRISTEAAQRAFRLAAEMQARRGEMIDEGDVARIAEEVGIDREYVRRALAIVQEDEWVAEQGAERANSPFRDAALSWGISGVAVIGSAIVSALGVGATRDGLAALSSSDYLGAVVMLGIGILFLGGGATLLYVAVVNLHQWAKRRG
jgi:hypothetical protein